MRCPKCGSEDMTPMIRPSETDAEKSVNPWTICGRHCEDCGYEEKVLEVCEKLCRDCSEKDDCSGALEYGISDEETVTK